VHLRSLSLRNYRLYRSVDLEFPDGLIGIYGANGSGKTTLIEGLRFGLYGDARTDKWELRSAGVGEDVRVELVFEHEGNTYDVRRRLKGRNLTPEVEVYLNGQLAAQSVREANAYLARVLGMDQRAFLASVCAQQKELTAFATMVPGDRRRLVLDLLGVSPVERALARVREQARDARTAAGGARAGLPDLAELEAAAAEAAAEQATADQADQQAAAAERAAAGAARLVPTRGLAARAAAAALYAWNPFVYERLVMGHWGLLVSYAALPWAALSRAARSNALASSPSRQPVSLKTSRRTSSPWSAAKYWATSPPVEKPMTSTGPSNLALIQLA
jgi:DNA repair exonuclease SbcCD ATPase subunit